MIIEAFEVIEVGESEISETQGNTTINVKVSVEEVVAYIVFITIGEATRVVILPA